MPWDPRRQEEEKRKRQDAIDELAPQLERFLERPTSADAILRWYLAVSRHCPLWSLQHHAYRSFEKGLLEEPIERQDGSYASLRPRRGGD